MKIEEIVRETKAYYCLECGKCTGSCPISRRSRDFSPRFNVERALFGFGDEILHDNNIWTCLSCGICEDRCASGVEYIDFIRLIREEAVKAGERGRCAHAGILFSLMRLMTREEIRQNRLKWVSSDLKVSKRGEILYFVGCLPYFDVVFKRIELRSVDIARNTVAILNKLGISPVLMENERCCGHDLLWTGDIENFERLARLNIEMIKNTGAKKVIFSCPECYRTLKLDYPSYVGDMDFEMLHISEFLAEKIEKGELKLENEAITGLKVTYHDPCRLGRHLGVYDAPRYVMHSIKGVEVVEMERSRDSAVCCGTSAWTNCDMLSEEMQMERIKEARATNADTLITACPKCMIHFRCGMSRRGQEKIEVRDFVELVAKAMGIE
ncbi:MAG: (Fe-S)-binding protein [Candidatus Methanospirareceae archaeon]